MRILPARRLTSARAAIPAEGENRMSLTRKAACFVYGLIGLLALIGTWGNNLQLLGPGAGGFLAANLEFWKETLANPASRSITVDIFFLSLAIAVWMVLEARRLGMRGVWLYLLFGMLVAISFTVPLFMINRERALAAREAGQPAGRMAVGDALGLVALGLGSITYAVITLLH
jgi:hypothetical protein